jgi:hypothetical protein
MKKLPALLLALCLFGGACARLKPAPLVLDTLYFGMKTPVGQVSEKEWADFVDFEVTPRFGDGFTVWDAKGQWKDSKGFIVQEPTKVLQIAHPDSAEAEGMVKKLIQSYKTKFAQESVLRAKGKAEFTY